MSVTLPSTPGPVAAEVKVVDFGGELSPALGGPVQRINRVGTRLAMAVTMPPMNGQVARPWISRLLRGKLDGLVMAVAQPGLAIGSPGAPVVSGGGQTGSTLSVRSGAAGYVYRDGQFVSIIAGGRRYLHMITGDVTANGSGAAVLGVFPPLRVSPADGAGVEVAAPKIEGLLIGEEASYTVDYAAMFGLKFTITEAV